MTTLPTTVLDFETYYEKSTTRKHGLSIVDDGLHNYVRDSYAYIVSIVGEDGFRWSGEVSEAKAKFGPDFWLGREWVAANSNFELAWARKEFGNPFDKTPIQCVLDRAAVAQMPRNLADLSKVVLKIAVDKSARDEMNGVHWESLPTDAKQKMLAYCLKDSEIALQLWKTLPPMSSTETQIAAHTRRANWDGVHLDTELMDVHAELLNLAEFEAASQIPWRNTHALGSPIALAKWCQERGFEAPKSRAKDDEECDYVMTQHPEFNSLLTILRIQGKCNNIQKKLKKALRLFDHTRGVMPMDLRYCGAPHTRRWSSKGVNVQNLHRDPFWITVPVNERQMAILIDRIPRENGEPVKDDKGTPVVPIDAGGGFWKVPIWTRNWVVPPPGCVFISSDLAQIEPRVVHWLAGNDAMLQLIATGYSVYEAAARLTKGWNGKPGSLKKDWGVVRYTKLKNEVIGLGYGMGSSRYADYANVEPEEAKTTVDNYRRMNVRTVRMWKILDEAIQRAALSPSGHLSVDVPTGETLQYFDVRAKTGGGGYRGFVVKGDWGFSSKQERLWGGTLLENVTQRTARDIIAEHILEIERTVGKVAFTAHDETNTPVPIADAEDAKKEIEHIMSKTPEWIEGLPLGVEAKIMHRYAK